jgi:hypothetical protein
VALSSIPPIDVVRLSRDPVSFCTHCGRRAVSIGPRARICARCELGLMLQADSELAPSPGDAFIVVDRDLLVCAVSAGAERVLGAREPTLIHATVDQLLRGAGETDAEAGERSLLDLLRAATRGRAAIEQTVVSLVDRAADGFTARLGPCGPPAAALLVLGEQLPVAGSLG